MKVVTLFATLAFLYAVAPAQGFSLGVVPKFLTTVINAAKDKFFKDTPDVVNDFAVAVNDGAEIALQNGLQLLNQTLTKESAGKNGLISFFTSTAKSCAANTLETGVKMFQPSIGNVGKLVTTMLTTGINPLFSFFASAAKSCATTAFTNTLTMINPKLHQCAQVIKTQLNIQSVIANVSSSVKATLVSSLVSSSLDLVHGNDTDVGDVIRSATHLTAISAIDSGLKIVDSTFGACEKIFAEGVDVDAKIGSTGKLFQFVGEGLDRINSTLFKGAEFLKTRFAEGGILAKAEQKIKSTFSKIASAGKSKIKSIISKTKNFFIDLFDDSEEEEDAKTVAKVINDEAVAIAEIVAEVYADAESAAEAAANSVEVPKANESEDEDIFYSAEDHLAVPY